MSLDTMATRLDHIGGYTTIERMNKQKLRSFEYALKNDYNSREIELDATKDVTRAVITQYRQSTDEDLRYVSVHFGTMECGDTFKITDDGTHWMAYLQEEDETAYFRAQIVRCRYILHVDDAEYWVYFRGPTETDISWGEKSREKSQNLIANKFNLSGIVYVKADDRTKDHFDRFDHITLAGHTWEVTATDSISVQGIIELSVIEAHENPYADLAGVEVADETDGGISGAGTIDSADVTTWYYADDESDKYEWTATPSDGITVSTKGAGGGRYLGVTVESGQTGSIALSVNDAKRTIAVSLPGTASATGTVVSGPDTVDAASEGNAYTASVDGTFTTSKPFAVVTKVTDHSCYIDVRTMRAQEFTLTFTPSDGSEPVTKTIQVVG